MGASSAVQWGILGTGSINERFLRHVREAPDAEFVAVGSRRFAVARSMTTTSLRVATPCPDAYIRRRSSVLGFHCGARKNVPSVGP